MQCKVSGFRQVTIATAVLAIVSAVICAPASAQTYTINLAAGGGSPASGNGDGGLATNAALAGPFDVAVDRTGNLYIADTDRIRKVSTNGIITSVAGGGTPADGLGDNGPALAAKIQAFAIAVDAAGNIYLADSVDSRPRIRRVDTNAMITTVAGNGTLGFSGDGGPATKAQISDVLGLAVDATGNLYLADRSNSRIRKVATDGTITTVAGGGKVASGNGDGGLATNAALSAPYGVAVDGTGDVIICDQGADRIRRVDLNGIITTVAGNGNANRGGDGGLATQAGIDSPWHIAADAAGRIYITERLDPFASSSGNYVRLVSPDGIITTIAGNGDNTLGGTHTGYGGDGGPALQAELHLPEGIAVNSQGLIYVTQLFDNRVRVLTPTSTPPLVPALSGIANAAGFADGATISPGSWAGIFGTNLAPAGDGRVWNAATEIVNGRFPLNLDGTSVAVDGKPAPVEYISPGQVNIQVPDDTRTGPVQVVVTTPAGTTAFTANLATFAPGLFTASATYLVAQHADYSYVTAASPAKPGEVITLWGTGFGPANPPEPSGQVLTGTNPLANQVTVTIGGQQAAVQFDGLVEAGLVQINVQVPPNIGNGDAPVLASVGNASTQTTGNLVSIHN